MGDVNVIGAGLAGCEAAWQLAQAGFKVDLFEMRPGQSTGAHQTGSLAELVCSNSFGSTLRNRPLGLLQLELQTLDSLLLNIARDCSLPAGRALAVDRDLFSRQVTQRISNHAYIHLIREEVTEMPTSPTIIASGPLTSSKLADAIIKLIGTDMLYFYDAMAPIVTRESIDMTIAFKASRYQQQTEDSADYINCPLSRDEYDLFVNALLSAKKAPLLIIETQVQEGVIAGKGKFFEGCLPIEILANRHPQALTFGPMRPVGLTNPHDNSKPFAVVQLRQEDLADSLYNMVGFQTNLTYPEQTRVFRLIPGLGKAEFVRFGQMHRNTFLCAPKVLLATMQSKFRDDLFFAGQITGVEGYLGNIASGYIAGQNMARLLANKSLLIFPRETMLGSLMHYLENASPENFQPMKPILGLLPDLGFRANNKQEKGFALANRSMRVLSEFCQKENLRTA